MRPRVRRREKIIKYVLDEIEASNELGYGVIKRKLVAETSLVFACSNRLVSEVLNNLIAVEVLKEVDNKLYISKKVARESGGYDALLTKFTGGENGV